MCSHRRALQNYTSKPAYYIETKPQEQEHLKKVAGRLPLQRKGGIGDKWPITNVHSQPQANTMMQYAFGNNSRKNSEYVSHKFLNQRRRVHSRTLSTGNNLAPQVAAQHEAFMDRPISNLCQENVSLN